MIYQAPTFFFLKGSLQGNFENTFFKGTAHRFQWTKIEKNWGIVFSTLNEATAHITVLKFVKTPISSHPSVDPDTIRIRIHNTGCTVRYRYFVKEIPVPVLPYRTVQM